MGKVILGKTNKHPLLGNPVNANDFRTLTDHKLYTYYKEHGGKLSIQKYKSVKKALFIKFMEYVMFKGRRMDIPFFGEMFVQETKVPIKETKNNIKENNHYISELLLQRYNHSRMPMNLYQDIEITLQNRTRLYDAYIKKGVRHFTKPIKDRVQRSAIRAKRKDKNLKFIKSYKKHDDYVYPEE